MLPCLFSYRECASCRFPRGQDKLHLRWPGSTCTCHVQLFIPTNQGGRDRVILGTSNARAQVTPRLRVTSVAEQLWPEANWQSFDFGGSKQLFHTSQTGPPFCASYWVTTSSSAKHVSGWSRERNLVGVTGVLWRQGLIRLVVGSDLLKKERLTHSGCVNVSMPVNWTTQSQPTARLRP